MSEKSHSNIKHEYRFDREAAEELFHRLVTQQAIPPLKNMDEVAMLGGACRRMIQQFHECERGWDEHGENAEALDETVDVACELLLWWMSHLINMSDGEAGRKYVDHEVIFQICMVDGEMKVVTKSGYHDPGDSPA